MVIGRSHSTCLPMSTSAPCTTSRLPTRATSLAPPGMDGTRSVAAPLRFELRFLGMGWAAPLLDRRYQTARPGWYTCDRGCDPEPEPDRVPARLRPSGGTSARALGVPPDPARVRRRGLAALRMA